MRKILLTGVAAVAILSVPTIALANGQEGDGRRGVHVDGDIEYENEIDTTLDTHATYWKLVGLLGGAVVLGEVDVDSSAVAITDAKQVLQDVAVTYREENELNGENGYVDPVFGPGWSEAGNDPNDQLTDGVLEDQIRVGYFAPIINTVDPFAIDSSGNTGVNLAAGYFNMQMNSASLATSANAAEDAVGGWAEASTTGLQSLTHVSQADVHEEVLDEDNPEAGGGSNNFRDRNSVLGGTISGSGNIGVNAAAGSLNQQANLMTLAVANDSTLAEANAGLMQYATMSFVQQQDSKNLVTGLSIEGTSGNIGVNFASGVGNQQMNALTIAASSAGAAPADTGGGTGGGDGS